MQRFVLWVSWSRRSALLNGVKVMQTGQTITENVMHLHDVAEKDRIVYGLKLKIVYSSFWSSVERLNLSLKIPV
jgi:hypothetical protein